jgi:hypothetical protein
VQELGHEVGKRRVVVPSGMDAQTCIFYIWVGMRCTDIISAPIPLIFKKRNDISYATRVSAYIDILGVGHSPTKPILALGSFFPPPCQTPKHAAIPRDRPLAAAPSLPVPSTAQTDSSPTPAKPTVYCASCSMGNMILSKAGRE